MLDLGGGAVTTPAVREALAERRSSSSSTSTSTRPGGACAAATARSRRTKRGSGELYEERRPLYLEVADAVVTSGDPDAVLLAAAGIHYEPGALERLGELVPGNGAGGARRRRRTCWASTARRRRRGLGARLQSVHEVPAGEPAKQVAVLERLWSELRLDRRGTVVALGGGATTDVAGFAAATYLRGVPWVAVPTTLVGQVDASIGGKTAIDIPQGKNLVGAFHWPARTVIDPAVLSTLPERERRQGEAERVKTELLAGRPLDARGGRRLQGGALPARPGRPQRAALAQPRPHVRPRARGRRRLRPAARRGGRARACSRRSGCRGATRARSRSSSTPQPVHVDRDRAWEALLRDKKVEGGDVQSRAARRRRPDGRGAARPPRCAPLWIA